MRDVVAKSILTQISSKSDYLHITASDLMFLTSTPPKSKCRHKLGGRCAPRFLQP